MERNIVIEKILLYGSEAWYRNQVRINNRLIQLHRIALLNITKCYRTVSDNAFNVLSGVVPIQLQAQKLQKIYKFKRGITDEIVCFGRNYKRSQFDDDCKIYAPNLDISLEWSEFDENQVELDKVMIFTDGSKMDNGVGFGVVVYVEEVEVESFSYKLNHETSIFEAELAAISFAVNLILNKYNVGNIISDTRERMLCFRRSVDLRLNCHFCGRIGEKVKTGMLCSFPICESQS